MLPMVTDYGGYHQTLLFVRDIDLQAYTANKPDTNNPASTGTGMQTMSVTVAREHVLCCYQQGHRDRLNTLASLSICLLIRQ